MPVAEISAALQSLKLATDIARGIKSLKTEVAVNEKASELLDSIIDIKMNLIEIQNQYDSIQQEKRKLEAQIQSFENWSDVQKQYSLKEISKGIFVYNYLSNDQNMPPHFLCANCFESKTKSIMQQDWQDEYATHYTCPKCKNSIKTQQGNRGDSINFFR